LILNYSHRVLHISTGIHDLGPINWELALCLLLACFCCFLVLQGFKESRLLERYTKIYFHFIICCYQILNFIFVWCHSRQFILLHYSATWRTELADPKALFTFTHPNRGECLKLILLSRRIWTKIYMNLIEMPIDNSRYEVRKFPIRCDSMLHGFAGYFDYWTLDVSRNCCSCLSSLFRKWLFKLMWFTSLVLVPTWLLTILLFTYDCILTIFRENTVIKTSGDKDNKVSWSWNLPPDFTDE
jgi:hypothetical protein